MILGDHIQTMGTDVSPSGALLGDFQVLSAKFLFIHPFVKGYQVNRLVHVAQIHAPRKDRVASSSFRTKRAFGIVSETSKLADDVLQRRVVRAWTVSVHCDGSWTKYMRQSQHGHRRRNRAA